MAIDTSLYGVDLPAGTYAVGDVLQLGCVAGPANVRSGRGSAILKQIIVGQLGTANAYWRIHVKNSDWVDDVQSVAVSINAAAALDENSGLVQNGCDNALTENSGWQIYAECINGSTTTAAVSLFALIDIDYPSVSSITDPAALQGVPTSISADLASVPINADGTLASSSWKVQNVDYFKAGYQYCLQNIEMFCGTAQIFGFVALSSAAGMGGLQRIIPVVNDPSFIRSKIRYGSKLVKGPMDVKVMLFAAAATTANISMVHDYVKRAA